MSGFNFQQLQSGILAISNSNDWDKAKKEWDLDYIYESGISEVCLCGHRPIRELCVLKNSENGNSTIVGNICVKKFMDNAEPSKIFKSFKRVQKDATKSLNPAAIEYANRKQWLRPWEFGFLKDTRRTRYSKMTPKQQFKRVEVNSTVVRKIKAAIRPKQA